VSRKRDKNKNQGKSDLLKGLTSLSLEDIVGLQKTLPTVLQSKLQQMSRSDNLGDLVKANLYMGNINQRQDDVKAVFFNPDEASDTGRGYKDPNFYGSMPFEVLRRMGDIFVVRAVVNTRVEQVQNFLHFSTDEQKEGYTIRRKRNPFEKVSAERSREDQIKINYIRKFLEEGGFHDKWESFDTFQDFGRKVVFDSLTLDQLAFEIVRDRSWNLARYRAVDASLVRFLDSIDPKFHEEFEQYRFKGYLPKYCMCWQGQIMQHPVTHESVIFYPWELGIGIRNKSTNIYKNGYGTSELETLSSVMTWILWGFEYNGSYFSKGSNPKGIINVKNPNISQASLSEFRQAWQQTMVGTRNCLVGSTKIVTENEGLISLEDSLKGLEYRDVKIWTGKSFVDARITKTQKKKICKLGVANGMYIESSPEHRFKVVSDNGVIEWKERKDIKLGDYILSNKKSLPQTLTLYYKGKELEADFYEVLGWLVGDGWFGKNEPKKRRISLFFHPIKEIWISEYIHNVLNKYRINNYIKRIKITEEQAEETKRRYGFKSTLLEKLLILCADKQFFEFLMGLGFTPSCEGKTIAPVLFRVSSECRCAFIRGFFSADGSTAKNSTSPQITIVDNRLRRQFRELLLAEGIQCTYSEGNVRRKTSLNKEPHEGGFLLLIKNRKDFFEKISFLQEYKQRSPLLNYKEPFSLHPKMMQKIANDMRVEAFKRSVFKEENQISKDLSRKLIGIGIGHDGISQTGLCEVAEKMNFDLPYEYNDFYFSEVKFLEETDEEVEMYDVEVFDNEHQFIANGILTHNSHRTPIINGLDLQWVDLSKNTNRDMEFSEWVKFLLVMTCAVYRIDPSELGFQFKDQTNIFGQAGQKERLQHSKDKGLKPILVFLQEVINYYLVSELDEDFEFVFTGVDAEDEGRQVEIDAKKIQNGMVCLEDIFEKYSGRKFNPETDTILNQSYQLQKQYQMQQAMYGGDAMNEEVDRQIASEDKEDTQKSFDSNPIMSAAMSYIEKNWGEK
jgi:intein/homing endonuclease